MVPPRSISNSGVKRSSGDDSWGAAPCENSSMPGKTFYFMRGEVFLPSCEESHREVAFFVSVLSSRSEICRTSPRDDPRAWEGMAGFSRCLLPGRRWPGGRRGDSRSVTGIRRCCLFTRRIGTGFAMPPAFYGARALQRWSSDRLEVDLFAALVLVFVVRKVLRLKGFASIPFHALLE